MGLSIFDAEFSSPFATFYSLGWEGCLRSTWTSDEPGAAWGLWCPKTVGGMAVRWGWPGPGTASRYPLSRLLQLILSLQTERCPNARQLSEICEVSRRTIYRDLAALAHAGITVLYRPDRQGYQLARSLFLQPPRMEERVALALLLLCRQVSPADSLGLESVASQAVDKLIQCLPEVNRTRLMVAAEILGDPPPRPGIPADRKAVHEQLLTALGERRQSGSGSGSRHPTAWRPRKWRSTGWPGSMGAGAWSADRAGTLVW
jgi:hypothetical protein